MNDIRFPGLRGAMLIPPPNEPASGRKATPTEPVPFDRAMERSVTAGQNADERLRDRAAERNVERKQERAPQRTPERTPERLPERGLERATEHAPERAPERMPRPTERGADDARRADDTARAQRRDVDRVQTQAADRYRDAPRTETAEGASTPRVAAPSNAGDAPADAPVDGPAAQPAATAAAAPPAASIANDADATMALLAASTALTGNRTLSAMANESAAPGAADADALAPDIDGVAVRLPTLRLDPLPASAGKAPAASADADEASTGTDADAGKTRPGVLPELTADLTRSPAKDRLLEDFERRFESSLARAAGANGQSPLNALGPLASAGLPANLPAPGATLSLAQATVSTPIGHPAFAADLSHRVLLFAGQRVQSAQITVTPNDLGPISVSIEMTGQEAVIQFTAAHATTRAAIEDAMPRLREMLAAQGLQLTQADVGDQAQRDAHASQGDRQGGRPPGGGAADGTAAGRPVDAEHVTLRRIGLIDIRV